MRSKQVRAGSDGALHSPLTWSYSSCWGKIIAARKTVFQLLEINSISQLLEVDSSSGSVKLILGGNLVVPSVHNITEFLIHKKELNQDIIPMGGFDPHCRVLPMKVKIFIYRLLYDRLPTRINLFERHIQLPSVACPMCEGTIETVHHLFFECVYARSQWSKFFEWWGVQHHGPWSMTLFLTTWPASINTLQSRRTWTMTGSVLLWYVWWARNRLVFRRETETASAFPISAFESTQTQFMHWVRHRDRKY